MQQKPPKLYLIGYMIIIVILGVSLNLYLQERNSRAKDRKRHKYRNEFLLQKSNLESGLNHMFNNIYLQRELIEQRLKTPKSDAPINLQQETEYQKELSIYSLARKNGNLIIADKNIYESQLKRKRLQSLIDSFSIQNFLIKQENFADWSVFYTSDYIGIIPGGEVRELLASPEKVFSKVETSLNKINNQSNFRLYKVGWETSVFKDNTGQILMFSKNLPVKIGDRYIGILTNNIEVAKIDKFINQTDNYEIYIANSYQDLIYKNGASVSTRDKLSTYFPEVMVSELNKVTNRVQIINNKEASYFISGLQNSDWILIFKIDNNKFKSKYRYWDLILVNLLIFGIGGYGYFLLSKRFKVEQEKKDILARNANYDYLTGVFRKRYFFKAAQKMHDNGEQRFTICMLDIDSFKQVNDDFGHDAGDYILEKTAEILENNIRESDIVARFGGDEFCFLLKEVGRKGSYSTLNRIRKKVETTNFEYEGQQIEITVSVGIAYRRRDSVEAMVKKADEMLYQAKENGRNQVRVESSGEV